MKTPLPPRSLNDDLVIVMSLAFFRYTAALRTTDQSPRASPSKVLLNSVRWVRSKLRFSKEMSWIGSAGEVPVIVTSWSSSPVSIVAVARSSPAAGLKYSLLAVRSRNHSLATSSSSRMFSTMTALALSGNPDPQSCGRLLSPTKRSPSWLAENPVIVKETLPQSWQCMARTKPVVGCCQPAARELRVASVVVPSSLGADSSQFGYRAITCRASFTNSSSKSIPAGTSVTITLGSPAVGCQVPVSRRPPTTRTSEPAPTQRTGAAVVPESVLVSASGAAW